MQNRTKQNKIGHVSICFQAAQRKVKTQLISSEWLRPLTIAIQYVGSQRLQI